MIFGSEFKLNQTLFYSGLLVKILLGTLLASKFLTDLFIPFVDYFITSGFANPYQYFLEAGNEVAFPYPALMLYILSLPKLLLGWISPENSFFSLFIYRLPLLIADLNIFLVLNSWFRDKFSTKLVWFYWLSPVLIYISYIHGQLDVIPIAILFSSLFFLFKTQYKLSALCLGLSLATKTNVLLVYPFFFLFLASKKLNAKDLLLFFSISFSSFFVINLPYLLDPAFIQMVFQNQEQKKIFNAFILFNDSYLYIVPAALFMLFVRGLLLENYNKDIFIMLLGFGFNIILLFIPPAQGWYFWLIPFLAYFYVKEEGRSVLFFFGLQGFYILYFLLSKHADYLEVLKFIAPELAQGKTLHDHLTSALGADNQILGLVFTALQTTLLINCVLIYQRGLESYRKHKITSTPFLVGISGDSGSGKTTIADAISNIFTPQYSTVLRGDDMHKWQRGHEKWNELTHLDPKANYLHKEIDYLKKIKNGKQIYRRHYDHSIGEFTKESALKVANNLIIFEGLHSFYLPTQRSLYDLKIFIQPTVDLVHHWKILRDTEKRGHSKEKILADIKKREKDSKKYIQTQIQPADILIEPTPLTEIKNVGDPEEKVDIYYKILLSNSVYIEPLIEALQKIPTLNIVHDYLEKDRQSVVIKGFSSSEDITKITQDHITGFGDLGINNPLWPQESLGVLLLLINYYIFEKADSIEK